MKLKLPYFAILALCCILLFSFNTGPKLATKHIKFPYKRQGLTERQAAAHLLNRFTFGAKPQQVDEVLKMGLENWFEHQLNADLPEDSLNRRLSNYDALNYSNQQVTDIFPNRFYVYDRAVKDSVIARDSVYLAKNKKAFNDTISAYMKAKGYRAEKELYTQFIDQKILRAVYAQNQLKEVLTDFWFNHFNVSYSKNGPQLFIPSYERDVIRPNVTGKFDVLLLKSAKSPAMMHYLDNFNSVAPQMADQVVSVHTQMFTNGTMQNDTIHKAVIIPRRKSTAGLNENYAREVMELHTLGVDGGYTQGDVTQAARILTGWTVYPFNSNDGLRKQYAHVGDIKMLQQGYVRDSDFVFIPSRHDKRTKLVLGKSFDGQAGYQEGVDLLEMLAHHPSTAKFIARKIAVRFVSDNPPQSLLKKMSESFKDHDGDIKEVLITMVSSSEFWSEQSLRQKTKSPFELAISSLRSINADISQPSQIYDWIARMGQRIYYYLAPTGFPDKGAYWINTGSLLSRMNFGIALASHRIPGVKFDLASLYNNQEAETESAVLLTYGKIFMPERNLESALKLLNPTLKDPNHVYNSGMAPGTQFATLNLRSNQKEEISRVVSSQDTTFRQRRNVNKSNLNERNVMLSQVVGIIIGSPEYQRR